MPTRRAILGSAFPRALSGPFDDLFPVRLPAPRTLCEGMIVFTSASTVYYEIIDMVAPSFRFVNKKAPQVGCFLLFLPLCVAEQTANNALADLSTHGVV